MARSLIYSILNSLGDENFREYIHRQIEESIFDSHRITNVFPQIFQAHYEQMIGAFPEETTKEECNIVIANCIGVYLGKVQNRLHIEKIGEQYSENMNGKITKTSLWRKTL